MVNRKNIILNNSKTIKSELVINICGYQVSHNSIKPDPEREQPFPDLPVLTLQTIEKALLLPA